MLNCCYQNCILRQKRPYSCLSSTDQTVFLAAAEAAVVHHLQRLLIDRERSNKYYTQQEVELDLGLERGGIGRFYRSMNFGGGRKKKKCTMALLREAGVFRKMGKRAEGRRRSSGLPLRAKVQGIAIFHPSLCRTSSMSFSARTVTPTRRRL